MVLRCVVGGLLNMKCSLEEGVKVTVEDGAGVL